MHISVEKKSSSGSLPRLPRTLTLTHAVLYGLGVTIGAGIYVLVGIAAGRSGMHAPIAFVGAAFVMALSAASFAELGTRMPVSASEAAYVQVAFRREWLSLGVGLLVVVTATISAATISVGSAGYVSVFLLIPGRWVIFGVVVSMGFIACLATAQSTAFAGVMTLIEVGGLLLIAVAGLGHGSSVITRLPEIWPTLSDTSAWASIAGTAIIAVFSFIGFEHLVNVSEEMKDPTRTLPRALFLTLGVTAFLYALIIWIAVIAVPPDELARSSAPLALVFQRLTGLPILTMSAIAIIATLNGVIVHMIMISRVIYGLAEQGSLPKFLTRLNSVTHTPIVATLIAVVGILGLALAVPLSGLADFTSRFTLVIFAIVNLALIRIKSLESKPPPDIYVCPRWVPFAGFASTSVFLAVDLLTQ